MINFKCNKLAKSSRGMTMAEMLTVVAIIVILAGVAFIAVFNYQRSLAQLERDNTAREIFIAAQNHLTMSKGEGYLLKESDIANDDAIKNTFGNPDGDSYYIVVNNGNAVGNGSKMLDLMLPFGSIDETVRGGGSYIISYEKDSGTVLDVYYCSATGSPARFNHTLIPDNYSTVKDLRDVPAKGDTEAVNKKNLRRNVEAWDGAILGWYGGEDAGAYSDSNHQPVVKVINTSKLIVLVEDDNVIAGSRNGKKMRLIITGEQSGAGKYYDLNWKSEKSDKNNTDITNPRDITYNTATVRQNAFRTKTVGRHYVVIDDITTPLLRFASQFATGNITKDKSFIPGENLIIKAVAYNNTIPSNIEYSNEVVTGSLFESASSNVPGSDGLVSATISNFRHLQNLDNSVSGFTVPDSGKVRINSVTQTDNIYWNGNTGIESFVSELAKYDNSVTDAQIYSYDPTTKAVDRVTESGSMEPIAISIPSLMSFNYDGQNHSIEGITASGSYKTKLDGALDGQMLSFIDSGLFDNYGSGTISNLELANFRINGTGNCGSLVGQTNGTSITNVISRNTISNTYTIKSDGLFNNSIEKTNVYSSAGSAGGLVGSMNGGNISYSAAALYVKGTDSAGGLIGTAASGTVVTGCYSGGHTELGEYYKHKTDGNGSLNSERVENDPELFNVAASNGVAGGLIGDAGSASISDSYSTCSVSAPNPSALNPAVKAGGFVGTASGSITNCYAAGLVSGAYDDKDNLINNAFVGTYGADANNLSKNHYFSIVNEVEKRDDKGNVTAVDYKKSGVTKKENNEIKDVAGIQPVDASTSAYNSFVNGNKWGKGYAYDPVLKKYYSGDPGRYNLPTIDQLTAISEEPGVKYYVKGRHYGDWPAPEIFFINQS